MTTTRPLTRSALAVARQALATARDVLPACASKFATRTFTRHQLFARRAVRQFLRTDYRRLEPHRREWSDLRAARGLADRIPDHSTLHIRHHQTREITHFK
jgi:hypothetical protein